MEVAHAERRGRELTAVGTQLGAVYELRYRLEPDVLFLELMGQRSLEVPLGRSLSSSVTVVDAELDWREWTDPDDKKREAVTFRARQVLFEGGRPATAATADGSEQQNGAGSDAPARAEGEQVGVSTPGEAGSASADDLPF
jgi:hypothetical protein